MNDPNYQAIITSPIGKLGIKTNASAITRIEFLPATKAELAPQNKIAESAIHALKKYFSNPSCIFVLPLALEITDFQKKVLHYLQKIPVGQTQSYGDIAKNINTSARAVGNACRRNPVPIIIPCHRVVAKKHIGGFSGDIDGIKIKMKKWLLDHETINSPC